MKKLLLLTLILCLVLPCFGCDTPDAPPADDTVFAAAVPDGVIAEFEAYRIDCIDNQFYLNFSDGNDPDYDFDYDICLSICNENIVGNWGFPSPSQLKKDFLEGTLSDNVISWIKIVFPKNEHGIIIGNLQRIYVPKPLEGWTLGVCSYSPVSLITYFNSVDADAKITGKGEQEWLLIDSDMSYRIKQHNEAFEKAMNTYQGQLDTDDTGKETLRYSNEAGSFQLVRYEIQWGKKTIRVFEEYCFESVDGKVKESEEIPTEVNIIVTEEGHDYSLQLWDLSASLTVEDIQQLVRIQLLE